MTTHSKKFESEDEDYEVEKAPKRYNYKKIKLNVKREMIKKHLQNGLTISQLSRLFHLSYSTIAHILKTYKEKNVVFESKLSKMMREIEQSVKSQHQSLTQKQTQSEQKEQVKIQKDSTYYPFAGYWPCYYI